MNAPAPSAEEAAIIDRFGIFAEERVVEEVARALHKEDPTAWACGWPCSRSNHYRRLAAAAVAACRSTQDGGAEVARLSPDGRDVAIRRGVNDWRVSNGGHYRDLHVADWTPLAPQADR